MFKFHKTVQRFRAKKLKYWNSTSKGGGERRATTVDNSMVCGYFASSKSTSKKLSPLTPYFYLSLLFFFSRANETKEVNLSNSKKFYIIANYKRSCA